LIEAKVERAQNSRFHFKHMLLQIALSYQSPCHANSAPSFFFVKANHSKLHQQQQQQQLYFAIEKQAKKKDESVWNAKAAIGPVSSGA
jgi:hypothetical protein